MGMMLTGRFYLFDGGSLRITSVSIVMHLLERTFVFRSVGMKAATTDCTLELENRAIDIIEVMQMDLCEQTIGRNVVCGINCGRPLQAGYRFTRLPRYHGNGFPCGAEDERFA